MLAEKYSSLNDVASKLGIGDFSTKEADNKLRISGKTTYQLEKDLFWDAIKAFPGWDKEVAADIRVEKSDIHGIHTVVAGDSLSKIAKVHFDNPNRYMDIFNANKDQLKDPNLIHPGQRLVIPKK
ncbi:MAG: LysM peptidoglycan-binding domain-containing protein [Acidobacteria bacterium]|nr:LysM peptidoglycan-binding domain-containing protein [Acidobacteriota bacterium]